MEVRERSMSDDEILLLPEEPDFDTDPDYKDPELNLERLKETQRILSNVTDMPDDWKREQCKHIFYYYWTILKTNPEKESESKDYQKLVQEAHLLFNSLKYAIQTTGTFPIQRYRSAINRLLAIIEQATSMYELEDAMADLLS